MDTSFLSTIKQKLLSLKNSLVQQISGLRKPVDMGDDTDSFEEEADETTENVANAGMVETLKRRAHRVDDALQKMDKGTFGRCEKCSGQIEKELLEVDPESRYCRSCKLQMKERA